MNLLKCIEIGKECGMTNLRECFNNISFHSTMLFAYEDINDELNELIKEIEQKYGIGNLTDLEFYDYLEKITV